jgi:hypothetical protein
VGAKGRGLVLDFVNEKNKTFGQLVVSAEEIAPDPEVGVRDFCSFVVVVLV